MWAIILYKDLQKKRDSVISQLIYEENAKNYEYVSKYRGNRIVSRYSIDESSIIFKTKRGAQNWLKKYEMNKNDFSYSLVRNNILTLRKISKEEWEEIVDRQIKKLDIEHQIKRNSLMRKKFNWTP